MGRAPAEPVVGRVPAESPVASPPAQGFLPGAASTGPDAPASATSESSIPAFTNVPPEAGAVVAYRGEAGFVASSVLAALADAECRAALVDLPGLAGA